MGLCRYAQHQTKHDETVIENIFIREYMPQAPEQAVKIYLYGLMQCQSGEEYQHETIASFARSLQMEELEITRAFSYWQRQGLVSIEQSPTYKVSYHLVEKALPVEPSVYTMQDFNQRVNAIFAPRIPTPADLSRMYDWIYLFGIEEEAVLLMIEYGRAVMKDVGSRGVSTQIKYIDRIAYQWAEDGIKTLAKAEKHIAASEQKNTGLYTLMQRLGMNRNPTAAERKLYESWLEQGLTLPAILEATERMTGAYRPNFDYLNSILTQLVEEGVTDKKALQTQRQQRKELQDATRQALSALGIVDSTPAPAQINSYQKALDNGFTHEQILYACEQQKESGSTHFNGVLQLLNRWKNQKLTTLAQMKKYQKATHTADTTLKEAFARMGIKKSVTDADVQLYLNWTQDWGFSPELIFLASEYAVGTNAPYRYTITLLSDWNDRGIKSVRAAKKDYQSKTTSTPQSAKQTAAKGYEQRSYEKDDLTDIIEKL